MKKIYILDTNILLASPTSIHGFENNDIIICQTTLQELDSKKNSPGELGFNARFVIRQLDELRQKAVNKDLMQGVTLESNGTLKIVADNISLLPPFIDANRPDNRIIGTALYLKDINKQDKEKRKVILVTNDISMRINAASCGMIEVEDYKNEQVYDSEIVEYTGKYIVKVTDDFAKEVRDNNDYFKVDLPEGKTLKENEFIILKSKNYEVICIANDGLIKSIPEGKTRAYKVVPKNVAQAAALYALQAPVEDIPLVILKGPAGTSKTFLSLAAGLEKTLDSEKNRIYTQMLITRANVMADTDFGYLPGDLDDKMGPLIAPFMDNLRNLITNYEKDEDPEQVQLQIDDWFDTKVIDLCPMAYMRGRSICNSYLIVDEAQNCSRSQIRDIITRAGDGTKVILCGDPNQVDSPKLDKYNNGLVYAAKMFENSSLCAQITFESEECVRSELAKAASDLLK